MPTRCKLCGLNIPDGVTACSMCGSRNLVAVTPGDRFSASLPTPKSLAGDGQIAFSKWLWAIGLALIITPGFRLYAVMMREIPALYGEQSQDYLNSHPGLSNILMGQIIANCILILCALVLNFLFYARRRHFPILMVAYAAGTFVYLLATAAAMNSMFPDANPMNSFYGIVQSLLWIGPLIAYLLTSQDVKERFVK